MLQITATDDWRSAHPGAIIGLLELAGADNAHASPALDALKRDTEARLRQRYAGFARRDFLALPVMAAKVIHNSWLTAMAPMNARSTTQR